MGKKKAPMHGGDLNQGGKNKGKRMRREHKTRYFPKWSIAMERFVKEETSVIMELIYMVIKRGWENLFQLKGEVHEGVRMFYANMSNESLTKLFFKTNVFGISVWIQID